MTGYKRIYDIEMRSIMTNSETREIFGISEDITKISFLKNQSIYSSRLMIMH